MPGLTSTEAQATLDARFPTTGGTDHIAYSVNGTSEFAGLARTPVGATGWAGATAADPSVKGNGSVLLSAAATAAGAVSHYCVMSALTAGAQRTDWQAFDTPRTVAIGDKLEHAVQAIKITLT
jgi:hypothetical protein